MVKKRRKKKKKPSLFSRIFSSQGKRNLIPESIKPWVFGSLMLALTLFVLLSFFNLSGTSGKFFIKIFNFLLGKANLVLPLVFLLGGLSFFSRKDKNRASINLAMSLLLIGTSGFLAVFDLNRTSGLSFDFFYSGLGGWLGNLVAWLPMKIFAFWVSLLVFSLLIVISLLIFWYYLRPERSEYEEEEEEKEKETKIQKEDFIHKVFQPKFTVSRVENKVEEKKEEEKEIKPKTQVPQLKNKSVQEKTLISTDWNLPPLQLLAQDKGSPEAGDVKSNSEIIKRTFDNFDISVSMADINIGPTVTQYTLKPAEGVKLSKITALNNNLALALAAHPLRIEAPIPGKSLVGIEVPNKSRTMVRLRDLFSDPGFTESESRLLFSVGRDVLGESFYTDLARMPHLLVAGATGAGKTITLNSIMLSLLFRNSPRQLRFVLVDPKRVEFTDYNSMPHLLCPVIYDVSKTLIVLRWLINEMEGRFEILSKLGARNIEEYNELLKKNKEPSDDKEIMPYIVLIVDELADLMASKGRDIEAGVVKLAQKARAVGIHLILATQRPSVEVITGLIKANITSRIALQVASQVDSRTILDTTGAEKLLGRGDLLFVSAQISKPKRIQGSYVSSEEIRNVVKFIEKNNRIEKFGEEDSLKANIEAEFEQAERIGGSIIDGTEPLDPLYEEAKELVIEVGRASASFLQRKLRIGYARAARILDRLEDRGVIGPAEGAKPREVLKTIEQAIEDEDNYNEEDL
jgi:DNA segregation ATPase FtsK/SpoIIIE, S-DNA-T family